MRLVLNWWSALYLLCRCNFTKICSITFRCRKTKIDLTFSPLFPYCFLASEYQLNYPASGPKLYVHCLETYIRLNTNIAQGLLWGKLDNMYLYNIWIDGYNKSSFFVACVFTIFPWICSWTYCNEKNIGVSAYFTEVTHVGAYYKIQYCIKILC